MRQAGTPVPPVKPLPNGLITLQVVVCHNFSLQPSAFSLDRFDLL